VDARLIFKQISERMACFYGYCFTVFAIADVVELFIKK
jgi:hypothetical protein